MIRDAAARAAALDPSRSFIVQAPAGSGKTSILVQRFLRLLSGVERPESVVAITFTRKAAAEVKERIVNALMNAATGEAPPLSDEFKGQIFELAAAVLAQDRKQHWNLLDDPGRLQIQTIDSLCALLTRQMPVLSDFGGVNEVIEEASDLYLRAARETLTFLAEGDADSKALFHRMVLHFDNEVSTLERHLITMLGKRDQWEHLSGESGDQLVHDCCLLLSRAETQLRQVFQRAGKVDFTEIARAARHALGNPEQPSDLLYALDYRFEHLLVDEFQDTSRAQYELIKALTEQWSLDDRHTLFLVGDPMQSIYRFREADVGLFLHCWKSEQLGAVKLTPLALTTNFRTTSAILSWIESRVAPMMAADDLAQGAVEFRRSWSGRDVAGEGPQLVALINDKRGEEEAKQVVQIVEANGNSQIAILVRGRSHAAKILPALRHAAIPYEAVEIESLRDQQHIIDILSLTRALTNVADRVSWLACLRAPWCGLTLHDLAAIAEGKRDQTVLDLISDRETITTLSLDGRWRLVRTQEVLSRAVARLGRLPLRQLVEQTWHQLGGLAATPANNQREDIATLFRLIEESDEGGVIRDFSLLNKRLEFLYARPSTTATGVTVMTIHQAKGLEFDIVIIPQIGARPKSPERELLIWTQQETEPGELQLSIAGVPQTGGDEPNYKLILKINEQKEENEIKRLFYVACTRAVNRLYLLGNSRIKQNGECFNPASGSFLKLLWGIEQATFEQERQRHSASSQANFAFASQPRGVPLRRLPFDWQVPVLSPPVSPDLALAHHAASERQVSYRWVGDTGRHIGTVVHAVLNRIATEGIDKWPESRILGLRGVAGSELLRLGVPGAEEPAAAKQVLRAVINTLNSRRGRWILSPHAEARSEWSITGLAGGSVVAGTVDRAFRDESRRYWIVDFKTGEHTGGSLQKFLAAEKERYQPQLDLYASIVSHLVSSPVNLGLYFPLMDQWIEWHFTEAAAASSES